MSFVADQVAGGVLPGQSHGGKEDLSRRPHISMGRHMGVQTVDGVEVDVFEDGSVGDVINAVLLKHNTKTATGVGSTTAKPLRGFPSWGIGGVPCRAIAASTKIAAKLYKVKVLPIGDKDLAKDNRYLEVECYTNEAVKKDACGTLLVATEERSQVPIFLHSGSTAELVAPAANALVENGAVGSLVSDLNSAGEVDENVKAPLQSIMRPYLASRGSGRMTAGSLTNPVYGLAWQLATALSNEVGGARIPGHGVWADTPSGGTVAAGTQAFAGASYRVGGPLHVGAGASDKHKDSTNTKDQAFGPGHLNPGTPWFYDTTRDGPVKFDVSEAFPTELVAQAGDWSEVKLLWDSTYSYTLNGTAFLGGWRWAVQMPEALDSIWEFVEETGTLTGGGSDPSAVIRPQQYFTDLLEVQLTGIDDGGDLVAAAVYGTQVLVYAATTLAGGGANPYSYLSLGATNGGLVSTTVDDVHLVCGTGDMLLSCGLGAMSVQTNQGQVNLADGATPSVRDVDLFADGGTGGSGCTLGGPGDYLAFFREAGSQQSSVTDVSGTSPTVTTFGETSTVLGVILGWIAEVHAALGDTLGHGLWDDA